MWKTTKGHKHIATLKLFCILYFVFCRWHFNGQFWEGINTWLEIKEKLDHFFYIVSQKVLNLAKYNIYIREQVKNESTAWHTYRIFLHCMFVCISEWYLKNSLSICRKILGDLLTWIGRFPFPKKITEKSTNFPRSIKKIAERAV